MNVAPLRLILCISLGLATYQNEARASVDQPSPSLHTLRKETLGELIPKAVRESIKKKSSSVRLELRPGALKSVSFRLEPNEECGSPELDPAQDDAAELSPGVYQLIVNADDFHTKKHCFLALADSVSTLQIGAGDDGELTVRQLLQTEQPRFEKSRAGLKKDSYPILGRIVKLLKENPRILRLEVAVHTDSGGMHWSNMKLTGERAEAIVDYLVRKGIDPERLDARGYGSLDPLVKDSEPDAKLKNRRVEFFIRDVAPRKALMSHR